LITSTTPVSENKFSFLLQGEWAENRQQLNSEYFPLADLVKDDLFENGMRAHR
jgi:hypothetical protein